MTYLHQGAAHIYTAPTASELHTEICDSLAYGPAADMDMVTSVDIQKHNVLGMADSFEWDFDLRDLWLTKSRWTTMIRQYINPVALDYWLNSCEKKLKGRKRGVSVMRTNEVQQRTNATRGGGERVWRAWGSCMLAVGYRALPTPQITLHSRTSYLGYIGALDVSVAYHCARLVGERVGLVPEDIQFVWHLEAAQFHGFKSLAYLLDDPEAREEFLALDVGNDELRDKRFRREQPGLYVSRKWMNSFEKEDGEGKLYGDMNFGQTRRIRKRYHTEVMGWEFGEPFEGGDHRSASQNKRFKPLPSCPASSLTFDQLYSPAARRSTRVNWDSANESKVDVTNEKDDDVLAE